MKTLSNPTFDLKVHKVIPLPMNNLTLTFQKRFIISDFSLRRLNTSRFKNLTLNYKVDYR